MAWQERHTHLSWKESYVTISADNFTRLNFRAFPLGQNGPDFSLRYTTSKSNAFETHKFGPRAPRFRPFIFTTEQAHSISSSTTALEFFFVSFWSNYRGSCIFFFFDSGKRYSHNSLRIRGILNLQCNPGAGGRFSIDDFHLPPDQDMTGLFDPVRKTLV